jgi:transcriptional regulator with XRE-family HTH domain
MTIADRIRLIRQQKNIAQNELAQKTGINVKSLSRYELGNTIPPADALAAIAKALEVSADYLITGEEVDIKDKELYQKFQVIQSITGEQKKMIINFLDMAIRDFKTQQTYS